MANEITVTAGIQAVKNGITLNAYKAYVASLAGVGIFGEVQSIGFAAAELIALPADLTTEGVTQLILFNLDSTNYVEISLNDFTQKFMKIPALGVAVFPPYTTNPTYYAKANTAAVNLFVGAVGT